MSASFCSRINHAFSGLTGARAEADFDEFAERFPAVEILNGQMLPVANGHAEAFAARHRKIALAGSDSHTLAALGRTYTQVQGARDRREFLDGLKRGRTAAFGESGNYGKLLRAVLEISCGMMGERRWTAGWLRCWPAFPWWCWRLSLGNWRSRIAGDATQTGHGPVPLC